MTARALRAAVVSAAALALAIAAAARDYDPDLVVDHSPFDALLAKYVASDGVRYAAWKESEGDRRALEEYVATLAAAQPSGLPRYSRLAFWINAYNALTLDLVLDHYPVKSIKDIRSPWKRKLITVEGREFSLDEIENDIIRKTWKEPRIHFALNCAARSCPPLRAEAYESLELDRQLEEQTAAFLADERFNFVDDGGRLHLSKILDWYREDFEAGGIDLVDWVRPHVPALADAEGGKSSKVKFEGYDWALNEASE